MYQNIKAILYLVCDMFPHTSDLKLKYGAYCCDGLNFSEYNEKISSIVCNNCDCDKSKQPNVISFVTNSGIITNAYLITILMCLFI